MLWCFSFFLLFCFLLLFILFFFFFFFSSRRRHTRWNCDWSSDVCSSDLPSSLGHGRRNRTRGRGRGLLHSAAVTAEWTRSEERRVGKECRSRWSADH